ncbi:MAG TPA: phage holin family protein [Gemmatimonadales bacterium]|jgi:putative membrane protein|nr:phage holin family protein [Gemmatimonadales bacterium]
MTVPLPAVRRPFRSFLIRWMINTIALSAAVQLIPGIHFTDGPVQLLLVALVFGVVNAVLRPVLTVLSCPLVLLTLGLFTLVINGVMLMLTARLAAIWHLGFRVDGFWPAFWGGLVVGMVSLALALLVNEERRPRPV